MWMDFLWILFTFTFFNKGCLKLIIFRQFHVDKKSLRL